MPKVGRAALLDSKGICGMRTRSLLLVLTLLAAAATATAATAGGAKGPSPSCSSQVLEQPFKRWLDPGRYFLVPGGSMEDGAAGWQLKGSSVVEGNEPYFVHGAAERRSLAIPAGASATTPSVCVTLLHPTLRFFARNKGSLLGLLRVDAIVETPLGLELTLPVGVVVAGPSWTPTLPTPFLANALSLLGRNGELSVAFRFTSMLGGSFQVDDVYVDPYRSA
jgi:hypothetical protein